MHVVVAASGDVPSSGLPRVAALMTAADLLIAADGGLAHFHRAGIWPQLIVGDLDSVVADHVAAAVSAGTEVVQAPAAKDETDLELALQVAAERGASSITVVGLFGGRVDHELANIGLITSDRWSEQDIVMAGDDGSRRVWVVHDALELHEPAGTTVSVLPWNGPAAGVSNDGFEWPLDQAMLPAGTPRGMSNVASASLQAISVADGVLLVIVDTTED